jgi:hypothetical protein
VLELVLADDCSQIADDVVEGSKGTTVLDDDRSAVNDEVMLSADCVSQAGEEEDTTVISAEAVASAVDPDRLVVERVDDDSSIKELDAA